ncbi:AAA family ATPase [uncultured Pontibacter sp.]|uniref:AAA family ATPase n=1 Tax=uncultured Pontibacter sp. TaxID=453356 RepID=UPI002635826B|nr:AAA family ATPase [uncultured Pontibacter sp.]
MDNTIRVEIPSTDLNELVRNGQSTSSGARQYREFEVTGEQLLLEDVQEMEYLVYPLLPKTGVAAVAGASDTGKSMFLRDLAIKLVAGEDTFLDFPLSPSHKSCVYVSSEDGKEATAFLLQRQASCYDHEALRNLRFIFDFEELLPMLDAALDNRPADLVVVDCFSDVYSGDLKDTQKMRAFLNPYQKLAEKHKCLVLFLHHTSKRTEQNEPSKNNLLSGQGFEAKMRLVIEFRADSNDPNRRHLCIVKGNYLSSNFKNESFVLNFDQQNFTFSNSGERTPFELLVKHPDSDKAREKYEQARQLKEQGLAYDEIASQIGYANRGSVSKLFDKAAKLGWSARS